MIRKATVTILVCLTLLMLGVAPAAAGGNVPGPDSVEPTPSTDS